MRVSVKFSTRRVRFLCIRVCAVGIGALALVGANAHAQTINLSTNATINVPIVGGTTTVNVPVNVLGNLVNLERQRHGHARWSELAAHQCDAARHDQRPH